ncbi:hypothetical protein ANN_25607 [Periplaneta americana]|uniref:Uncharacterized protein n=1 Tax=Periplaneta americana TaxID=6978 RepID=A0ABQ8S1F4_PERAM|nr:hypothetical protein ANN_25607 [Periplaneta americana]
MSGLCEGGNEPPGSLKASVAHGGVKSWSPRLPLHSQGVVLPRNDKAALLTGNHYPTCPSLQPGSDAPESIANGFFLLFQRGRDQSLHDMSYD